MPISVDVVSPVSRSWRENAEDVKWIADNFLVVDGVTPDFGDLLDTCRTNGGESCSRMEIFMENVYCANLMFFEKSSYEYPENVMQDVSCQFRLVKTPSGDSPDAIKYVRVRTSIFPKEGNFSEDTQKETANRRFSGMMAFREGVKRACIEMGIEAPNIEPYLPADTGDESFLNADICFRKDQGFVVLDLLDRADAATRPRPVRMIGLPVVGWFEIPIVSFELGCVTSVQLLSSAGFSMRKMPELWTEEDFQQASMDILSGRK